MNDIQICIMVAVVYIPHYYFKRWLKMEENYIYYIYKYQIQQWHNSILQGQTSQAYSAQFFQKVAQSCQIHISFDDRIASLLNFLLLHSQFLDFKTDILIMIGKQLLVQKYISKRHLNFIGSLKNSSIVAYGNQFLGGLIKKKSLLKTDLLSDEEIEDDWEGLTKVNLSIFWNLIRIYGLKYQFLVKIFQETNKCKGVMENEKNVSHIAEIINSSILKQSQSLKKNSNRGQVIMSSKNGRLSISEEKTDIGQNQEKQKHETEQEFYIKQESRQKVKLTQQKIQQKTYKHLKSNEGNPNPYRVMKNYIKESKESKNIIEDQLMRLAFSNSLFFNRQNAHTIEQIKIFLRYANNNFFHDSNYKLQIFGSLRSKLALKGEYDIDITFICKDQMHIQRGKAVRTLMIIRSELENKLKPSWISKVSLLNFPNLPVPLLKVKIFKSQFQKCFLVKNIDKVDITAGNDTAAINSQMISHYAKIPEISLFCLLVKLWAKNCSVINKKSPMMGLSAYGVVLMCLYFLMQTKQISFIDLSEKQIKNIKLGSIIPNTEKRRVNGIQQNFINFLKFYREEGLFHTERKIVCLLKNNIRGQLFYKENILFNMYDFIDDSNPGRLQIKQRFSIFKQINRALQTMQLGNINLISNLFEFNNNYRAYQQQ